MTREELRDEGSVGCFYLDSFKKIGVNPRVLLAGFDSDTQALNCDVQALNCDVQLLNCDVQALNCDVHALICDVQALSCNVQGLNCDVQPFVCDYRHFAALWDGLATYRSEAIHQTFDLFHSRVTSESCSNESTNSDPLNDGLRIKVAIGKEKTTLDQSLRDSVGAVTIDAEGDCRSPRRVGRRTIERYAGDAR
jgi:hypothetical protein